MKKALVPILAIIAVVAIVFCFVINGQKSDVTNQLDEVKTQLNDMTSLKEAAEKAAAEQESKAAELESKAAELESKIAEQETKAAELESKIAEQETAIAEQETKAAELEGQVAELESKLAEVEAQQAVPEVTVPSPATCDIHLTLNSQAVAALAGGTNESMLKTVNAICDIVNNLGIRYVTDGVDSELFLSLKDETVLTAAILKDDNGLKILSDLIPNSILSVSAEDLGGMGAQTSVSPEVLTNLFTEPVAKVTAEITSRIGEKEAVEETIRDVVFTQKAPLNMSFRELSLLLLNTAKEITSAEEFTKLQDMLKQLNISFDAASIDEAIEKINNSKDEELPVMDAGIYSNEAGDSVTRILLTKDEQTVTALFGTIAGTSVVDAEIPGQLKFLLTSDKAGTTELSMDITAQPGMMISISGKITVNESDVAGDFKVSIGGMELVTVSFRKTGSGELTGVLGIDGKTEYTVKDLQDQTGEKYAGFMKDLQTGAMSLLSKAMKAVPSIMTLMMPSQSTQPAPAESNP